MAGNNKALQKLAGRPLLKHVIERLRPQCSQLVLSVEQVSDEWNEFGLKQVADIESGSNGPLGGLLAVLEYISKKSELLLLVPCDAPFLPPDLAAQLTRAAATECATTALVSWQGEWQPTFSLWHTDVLPELREAVLHQGQKGLKEFLRTQSPSIVAWREQQPSPFFNINHPEDLAAAAALLDPHSEPIS